MGKHGIIERTIIGTIFPAKWDENGKVTRVLIDTSDQDQDEYLIADNKKGKELLGLIHHKVEVTGTVRELDNDDLYFDVVNYKTKENNDEEKIQYA